MPKGFSFYARSKCVLKDDRCSFTIIFSSNENFMNLVCSFFPLHHLFGKTSHFIKQKEIRGLYIVIKKKCHKKYDFTYKKSTKPAVILFLFTF